jgi:hypothetical protein
MRTTPSPVAALFNIAARLVKRSFHLVSEFEAIFTIVIEPGLQTNNLLGGELGDGGFDFLEGTHARKIPHGSIQTSALFARESPESYLPRLYRKRRHAPGSQPLMNTDGH